MSGAAARTGLSLVEALLALVLLGLALGPVLGLSLGQSVQASQAAYLLEAQSLATQLLEEAEAGLVTSRFTLPERLDEPRELAVDWGTGPLAVAATLSARRSDVTTGLWRVSVALRWRESRGGQPQERSFAVAHLLADPGADGGVRP